MHKDLSVIHTGHWLDHIAPDYYNTKWGQTPAGLPRFVQADLQKLFPYHAANEKLSFGQVRDFRHAVLEGLLKSGVTLYTGLPKIENTASGYTVQINGKTLSTPKDTLFYHAYRSPQIEHGLGDHLPKASHSDLYTLPRNQLPKTVIILGGGCSTVWAAQHFPDIQFHCISRRDHLPLLAMNPCLTHYALHPSMTFRAAHPAAS